MITATELKDVASATLKTEITEFERSWDKAVPLIKDVLLNQAKHGRFTCTFNLKTELFREVSKDIDRLQDKFEIYGYKVQYTVARTPNGAREMIVSWK